MAGRSPLQQAKADEHWIAVGQRYRVVVLCWLAADGSLRVLGVWIIYIEYL